MSEPQIIRNADFYDLDTREHMDNGVSVHMCPNDTREQLEADVRTHFWHNDWCRSDMVFGWLDRQAAITKEYWANVYNKDYDQYETQIAELTAELYRERKSREYAYNKLNEMYAFDDKRVKRINELIAERDQLSRDLTAEHVLSTQFEDDNDRLREAIDAMNNGQFYSMYKAKCEECEQLKKVVRTQADSFKKLEIELAGKDG